MKAKHSDFILLQAHCQSHTACPDPSGSQRYHQSFVKELPKPAQVTAFVGGFRIAHAQKNKINLYFVDRLVPIDKKIEAK